VAQLCVHELKAAEFAVELARGETHRLTQVARILPGADVEGSLLVEIQAHLVEQLETQCRMPDASAASFAALAHVHRERGDHESAIRCFREALARDYGRVDYRLNLARQLAATGQTTEAMHEARVCLRLRPAYGPARQLIEELLLQTPAGHTGGGQSVQSGRP